MAPSEESKLEPEIPADLVRSIREGRCVAFVGAGFSIPSTPTWLNLLKGLVERVPDEDEKGQLRAWAAEKSLTSRDFEGIAAAVEGALGQGFTEALRAELGAKLAPETEQRLKWLREIPFHYVLTTNFDGHLGRASVPGPEAYAKAISARRRPWWNDEFWGAARSREALWSGRLLALHGSHDEPGSVVFTAESYRTRLHSNPAYRGFLRALFATHNVLYLGFSFGDAYVNDLRSEILSMVGLSSEARRLRDFAILEDVSPPARAHLERHEGLVPLAFDTRRGGVPKKDFSGFDRWLSGIHGRTSPQATLREQLRGKRVVWMDPMPDNNKHGLSLLQEHAGSLVTQADSVSSAIAAVRESDADLVITRWGHRDGRDADAVELLRRLERPAPPVVVFASGHHREENRETALRHGALAYADRWSELMEIIDERFRDSRRRV